MRIMGLDLGTRTIGVAVSDEGLLVAQPLLTLRRVSLNADIEGLKKLISEYEVSIIVVGLPVNMDGSPGERAEAVFKFAGVLRDKTGLTVETWDERLSTVAVTKVLIEGDISRKKRKEVVDKLAAAYILQGYLDGRRTSKEGQG